MQMGFSSSGDTDLRAISEVAAVRISCWWLSTQRSSAKADIRSSHGPEKYEMNIRTEARGHQRPFPCKRMKAHTISPLLRNVNDKKAGLAVKPGLIARRLGGVGGFHGVKS
jgi:hypothetical protein